MLALSLLALPVASLAASIDTPPSVDVVAPDEPIEGIDPALLVDPYEPAPAHSDPPTSYIVNGSQAGEADFPEVVYLEVSGLTGRESLCSGSLINEQYILTAAHCVDNGGQTSVCVPVVDGNGIETAPPPDISESPDVTIHFTNQFPGASDEQVAILPTETRCHPDWLGESGSQANGFLGDIAVLKLAEPVQRPVMAVNEDPMDASWVDSEITFIGFGITNWQGGGSGTKRFTSVPITRIDADRPHLVNVFNGVNSTCQGDSGGPGVVFTPGGGYSQVTVTSHGIECGSGPSGHMRVDHYLDWILQYVPEVTTVPSAPPSFVCSHRLDEMQEESRSFGIAPMELKCVVDFFAPDAVRDVTWRWGDGSEDVVTDSLEGTHTYEQGGRYSVEMCASYSISDDADAEPVEACVARTDAIQVCATPDAGFEIEREEGLTYQFLNTTNLNASYGCINDLEWNFYEGDTASGEPIDSLRSWEPAITFDRPGTYTAVLHVGGIGGTAAATATFRVTPGGPATCSHLGGAGGGLLVLGLGLLAVRRRQ